MQAVTLQPEPWRGEAAVYLHVPSGAAVRKVVSWLTVEPNDSRRGTVERLVGKQGVWVE